MVTVRVINAADVHGARSVAKTISHSMLVKTALFGSDGNWGRIMAAVGRSGVPVNPGNCSLHIGDLKLFVNGSPVANIAETTLKETMSQGCSRGPRASFLCVSHSCAEDITITVSLGTGTAAAQVYTCDLGVDYVSMYVFVCLGPCSAHCFFVFFAATPTTAAEEGGPHPERGAYLTIQPAAAFSVRWPWRARCVGCSRTPAAPWLSLARSSASSLLCRWRCWRATMQCTVPRWPRRVTGLRRRCRGCYWRGASWPRSTVRCAVRTPSACPRSHPLRGPRWLQWWRVSFGVGVGVCVEVCSRATSQQLPPSSLAACLTKDTECCGCCGCSRFLSRCGRPRRTLSRLQKRERSRGPRTIWTSCAGWCRLFFVFVCCSHVRSYEKLCVLRLVAVLGTSLECAYITCLLPALFAAPDWYVDWHRCVGFAVSVAVSCAALLVSFVNTDRLVR